MDAKTIYLVTFRSEKAKTWQQKNIPPHPKHLWYEGKLVVEHRYINEILYEMKTVGLIENEDFSVE